MARFTKTQYELISDVIDDEIKTHKLGDSSHDLIAIGILEKVAIELANEFQLQDPGFLRGRFLMECGVRIVV